MTVTTVIMLFCTGCFYDNTGEMIYIVSKTLGDKGKIEVPSQKFQAVLSQTVFRSHRSTLSILNQQTEENSLELSRIALGLKLEFEAGIQNIAKVAGESVVELRFQRLPPP
jgi:hypothetical protein